MIAVRWHDLYARHLPRKETFDLALTHRGHVHTLRGRFSLPVVRRTLIWSREGDLKERRCGTRARLTPTKVRRFCDYVRILRRRMWIVLVAVMLVPLAAVAGPFDRSPCTKRARTSCSPTRTFPPRVTGLARTNGVSGRPSAMRRPRPKLAMTPAGRREHARLNGNRLDDADASFSARSRSSRHWTPTSCPSLVTNRDPELAQRLAEAYAREFTEYKERLRHSRDPEGDRGRRGAASRIRGERRKRSPARTTAARAPADARDDGDSCGAERVGRRFTDRERFRSLRSPSGTASSDSCSGSFSA